ncbi:MAG: WYL domain-containing protein [Pseudoclavibacter caeni]|jgi:proteasome accessory factor C
MSERATAADRFDLALLLVPWVLANPGATVTEIADRFEATPAVVRRLVRLLPLVGVPGEMRTYGPESLFDIDREAFENEDRVVITHAVGLNRVQRFTAGELAGLQAAMNYLAAVLPQERRTRALDLLRRLGAGPVTVEPEGRVAESLAMLRARGAAGDPVAFDYVNASGERSHRVVSIDRLRFSQGTWYLLATDGSEEDARPIVKSFRIDRMTRLCAAEVTPAAVHGPDPEEAAPIKVTLEVQREGAAVLMAFGESIPADARWPITRTVSVGSIPALVRHISSLPGRVRVIAPDTVRRQIADRARRALAGHRPPCVRG